MISALKIAEEMIIQGSNGYFIAGLQGVLIGLALGIELIIILEICTKGKESSVIKYIEKFRKVNQEA